MLTRKLVNNNILIKILSMQKYRQIYKHLNI